jgi:hypothetical protein
MRKKLFFGLAAAALVALNVVVFTTASHALPPQPPPVNGCYQTRSYCKDGATLVLRDNCTLMNTNVQCKKTTCIECVVVPYEEILEPIKDEFKPFRP